ncbi:TPA: hypothetical protein ACH3X2_012458 [Trebouxia sp. C0005]
MGDFCSLADLNSYLLEISPRYGKYAADLWDKNIRSPAQLANVSITHLADCGISNIAHAKTIQAYSADCGASTYIRHRHQIKCAFHEWLRELDQRKAELTGSQPTADSTPSLSRRDVNLDKLLVEVDDFIAHIQMVLKQDWLDTHQDVVRIAKVDLDSRIDIAMLPYKKTA